MLSMFVIFFLSVLSTPTAGQYKFSLKSIYLLFISRNLRILQIGKKKCLLHYSYGSLCTLNKSSSFKSCPSERHIRSVREAPCPADQGPEPAGHERRRKRTEGLHHSVRHGDSGGGRRGKIYSSGAGHQLPQTFQRQTRDRDSETDQLHVQSHK